MFWTFCHIWCSLHNLSDLHIFWKGLNKFFFFNLPVEGDRSKPFRWVGPLPSNSHHQDLLYTFLVGDPCTPSFPLLLGTGQPNLYQWKRSIHKDLLLQDVFKLMSAMIKSGESTWCHGTGWNEGTHIVGHVSDAAVSFLMITTSKVWRFLTFSQRLWRTWPFYILCFLTGWRNWLEHNNPAVAGKSSFQFYGPRALSTSRLSTLTMSREGPI